MNAAETLIKATTPEALTRPEREKSPDPGVFNGEDLKSIEGFSKKLLKS